MPAVLAYNAHRWETFGVNGARVRTTLLLRYYPSSRCRENVVCRATMRPALKRW